MITIYNTPNIKTEFNCKNNIIHWTVGNTVPQDEWEASLMAGLNKTQEIKICAWLNDLTDFKYFEEAQIDFVNNVVNQGCAEASFPSNIAFVESKHPLGNAAIHSYIAHTNVMYPDINICVFKEKHNAEQWLLTRQLICI